MEANPTLNERSIGILLSTPYGATPFVNGRLTVIQEGSVLAKISTDQEKVNFKTEGGEYNGEGKLFLGKLESRSQ